MEFKQAWRAVGNPTPGNTTWSADVDGVPVFTAWRDIDFKFDKASRRSKLSSPAGRWTDRGEGQSYLRRARLAKSNAWVCRLIVLDGKAPWQQVQSANFDEVLYAVRFTEVSEDGSLVGDVLTQGEYLKAQAGSTAGDA